MPSDHLKGKKGKEPNPPPGLDHDHNHNHNHDHDHGPLDPPRRVESEPLVVAASGAIPPPEPELDLALEDAGARALDEALRSSFKIVKWLMVGLVVIFIASGIFTVNPNELAVKLRFGKPVGLGSAQLLKPGLHWSLPYPVDEIVRIPVGQSHTVISTAGWYAEEPGGGKPMNYGFLRAGVDGSTMTGDGNLIHARATLKYRLRPETAANYIFNYGNPTNILVNVLNNALLYASTYTTADNAIFRDKLSFRELVSQRVNQLLEQMQLGIILDSLEVETSAPLDVQPAFDNLVNAQQTASTRISEAVAYATGATNTALAQASFLVAAAMTRSNELVKITQADAGTFTKQLPHFLANPQLFKERLLAATLPPVFTNALDKFFIPNRADGRPRELRLQLSREPLPSREPPPR